MTVGPEWKQHGKTAVVTLNRPQAFNAFDADTVHALSGSLAKAATDAAVQTVVITGKGKAFCAGGDLRWARESGMRYGAAFHELAAHFHHAITEIRRMPKPVVAAVNGLAAGGGFSLALVCDFRVMARSAVLRQGYTSNGLSIDGGGTYTLARLVGLARALEIAAFDAPIDAEKALSWGLVTELVDDGDALDRALQMAERLQSGALSSFAASKRLLTDAFDTPFEVQLEREREWLSWCADHPNGEEGIAAFTEKRKPVYNAA